MRVFVAGATGAIGRQLAPLLVGAGHEVTALTGHASQAEALRAVALGAPPPRRASVWLARLAAGRLAVYLAREARGASNARSKRDLAWTLGYPSWRDGFRTGLE
jgi:nucleoside-diphosphate-sugar epimerase